MVIFGDDGTTYKHHLMNDLHEEDSWAPPRLSSGALPTVTEDITWDEEALARMARLEDVRGFRAAYAIEMHTQSRSPIVGEISYVSEEQFVAAVAIMRVEGFEHVHLTLDNLHVLVRVSIHDPQRACVLVLDRENGNPAIASMTLKSLCTT